MGLLYDRALLKAGTSVGVDTAGSNSGNSRNGGSNAASGAKASRGVSGGGGTAAAATATGARRDVEESAPVATVVELNSNSINDVVAQNVTARWTAGVVNGATTAANGQSAAAEASAPGGRARKKWSGKGWLVSRTESEEQRQGAQQPGTESAETGAMAAAAAEKTLPSKTDCESRPTVVNGFAAGAIGVETGRGSPSVSSSDGSSVAVASGGATTNATGPAVAAEPPPIVDGGAGESARRVLVTAPDGSAAAAAAASAGVDVPSPVVALGDEAAAPWQQQPVQRDPDTEELELDGEKGEEDVCTSARRELAAYLLEAGATDDLVAAATAALFAAEPRCTLTEGTWKRWRQNLDGLRSTGFTGEETGTRGGQNIQDFVLLRF